MTSIKKVSNKNETIIHIKPKVAIIYSNSDNQSLESKNMAYYLTGLLSSTDYAEICLISYREDSFFKVNESHRKIVYILPNRVTPLEVPTANITHSQWCDVEKCQLVIITVNTADTLKVCERLSNTLLSKESKKIPIFGMQRGVKNSAILKEELGGKNGLTVLDTVPGFAVVIEPKHSAFIATSRYPGIVYERLSKEAFPIADGPLRLLEVMKLTSSFRKILTQQAWGVMIFENIFIVNMITKGSLQSTLSNYKWRLIIASLIRENYKVLDQASRGGKWKPDLLAISTVLSPWMLEMIMVLPWPLFDMIFYLLALHPPPHIISPGQMDWMEGRKSMMEWHFKELMMTAKKIEFKLPIHDIIYNLLVECEDFTKENKLSSDSALKIMESSMKDHFNKYGQDSLAELKFWLTRCLAILSVVLMFIFLFFHEF